MIKLLQNSGIIHSALLCCKTDLRYNHIILANALYGKSLMHISNKATPTCAESSFLV